MTKINKNDFIEIEFTGKISNTDEVFDTNIKADMPPNIESRTSNTETKPFILSVGHKMLPVGFDADLEGKDAPDTKGCAERRKTKKYTINLKPEDAFGKRNPQLVRMIPTKHFHEQKIDPQRGMQLNLDGQIVKILSSDRGRTLVDFNNPLAGRPVTYTYKINRIVTDKNQKINALQDFLFRKQFDFEVKENTITFKIEKQFEPFIKMFTPKFEEILGMKIKSKIIEEK